MPRNLLPLFFLSALLGGCGGGQGTPVVVIPDTVVAFLSSAANLVPGDTNGLEDVFVHDRTTGETTRVSVASDGRQLSSRPFFARISADGRFVCFVTSAAELAGDGFTPHVFVHDRLTGATAQTRLSPPHAIHAFPAESRESPLGVLPTDRSNWRCKAPPTRASLLTVSSPLLVTQPVPSLAMAMSKGSPPGASGKKNACSGTRSDAVPLEKAVIPLEGPRDGFPVPAAAVIALAVHG